MRTILSSRLLSLDRGTAGEHHPSEDSGRERHAAIAAPSTPAKSARQIRSGAALPSSQGAVAVALGAGKLLVVSELLLHFWRVRKERSSILRPGEQSSAAASSSSFGQAFGSAPSASSSRTIPR